MRILHLTDFHFEKGSAKSILRQSVLCKALLEKVKDLEFDYIIFSGDLVQSGDSVDLFQEAFSELLKPILELKGMSIEQVFFCQGNHDINRKEIIKPYIKYIDEELKTVEQINNFADLAKRDFAETLRPSENYLGFINSLGFPKGDKINHLYTIHRRRLNGMEIGIVTMNSSWRSVDSEDENKLVYPASYLFEAINEIKDTDHKVIIHHHPISFFRTPIQFEIEDIIHNNFDISFFGHVHKGLTSIDYTPKTGLVKILSPASLKNHAGGDMGFSMVLLNFEESEFEVKTYLYNQKQEFYYDAPNKGTYQIPTSEEVREQNRFRAKLRKLIQKEKDLANELFVSFGDEFLNFSDLFIEPLLRKQNYQTGEIDKLQPLNINDVISEKNNFLISGDDKCGKTSLLKFIHIKILTEYESAKQISFYLDFSAEKSSFNEFVLEKRVKNYFEVNQRKALELLGAGEFVFLIDNFSLGVTWNLELLTKINEKYPNAKLIITAPRNSELILNPFKLSGDIPILLKFESLRNKQVRALTLKWTGTDNHKAEEIVSKINSLFRQLQFPFNFWNVSLFLWVVKKSGQRSVQNNVGLVDLYIESLLERENLIKSNSLFTYEKYLKLLAYVAHFLLVHHKENRHSAEELEILNFIGEYLKRNPRNRQVSPGEVWDYLKDRGIFKQFEDSRYSFRLNGVFEYFLAYYMKQVPSFRNEIIGDEHFYLSFKNEFEIYAGFSRDDEEFLDQILNRTKLILNKLNKRYDGSTLDGLLRSRAEILPNYERKLMELSKSAKSLTFDEQDKIEALASELGIDSDTIEGVREKQPLDLNQDEITIYEDALFILGRVFRNIDEINSERKVSEIFKYYLKSICHWGMNIIDTSKVEDFKSNFDAEDENVQLLFQLVNTAVPVIVQMTASNHLIQKNLESIIHDRIEEILDDGEASRNQFELFILYFMLCDLDLAVNKRFVEKVQNHIKINILKNAILLKLTNYLVFKTNEDPEIEQYLSLQIQKVRLELNHKTDIGDLQREIEGEKRKKYRTDK